MLAPSGPACAVGTRSAARGRPYLLRDVPSPRWTTPPLGQATTAADGDVPHRPAGREELAPPAHSETACRVQHSGEQRIACGRRQIIVIAWITIIGVVVGHIVTQRPAEGL